MANAIKASEARYINNRYNDWHAEFVGKQNDEVVKAFDFMSYKTMFAGRGDINGFIDVCMTMVAELTDASYGRIDYSFKVYGVKWIIPSYKDTGELIEGRYEKCELIYRFD